MSRFAAEQAVEKTIRPHVFETELFAAEQAVEKC